MVISLSGHDHIFSNAFKIFSTVPNTQEVDTEEGTFHPSYLRFKIHPKLKTFLKTFEKACSSKRFYNVPLINYIILSLFAFLLFKLVFRYHKLYTKSSLLATIATNLVLFGIADSMAQSIPAFMEGRILNRSAWISLNHSTYTEVTVNGTYNDINGGNNDDHSASGTEHEDFFVDYGDITGTNARNYGVGSHPYIVDLDTNYQRLGSDVPDDSTAFKFFRFFGFMLWGFNMAFVQVAWYSFLNSMFNDMPTFVTVLERDLTDQLCFSPISLMCFFTYCTVFIEGGTMEDVQKKLYKVYISTLACNFCLWFPVQFINFLVIPKKFQVPFSSTIGVLWNCFLSFRNASASS